MRLENSSFSTFVLLAAAILLTPVARADDEKPIAVAEIKRDNPVDFEKEILPVLRKNCLACHNSTKAEGDLILETPATILKGGSDGPAAVAGDSSKSNVFLQASHQQESFMPPADNEAGAVDLTSQELGLLKLWIDQGATGEVTGIQNIQWQPLPPGVNPIYSVAVTRDGQYAAAGRANQVFLYHVPSKRELGRLTDPAVLKSGIYSQPGVAHLDLVQSVAFSPNGQWLASGGYRTAKLWKRVSGQVDGVQPADLPAPAKSLAISSDGGTAVFGLENQTAVVVNLADGKITQTLKGHTGPVHSVAISADGATIATGSEDKTVRLWEAKSGADQGVITTPDVVHAVTLVGKLVATGGPDKIVRLWKRPADVKAEAKPAPEAKDAEKETAKDGEKKEEKEGDKKEEAPPEEPKLLERELPGHTAGVTVLAVVGEQLASAGTDGTVRIWNVADGKAVRTITHGGPVTAIAVQPGGAILASASDNKTIKLWETASGKMTFELKGNISNQLEEAASTRSVALANARIKLTEADLKAGNDRKKAEEDNAKKAEEALKKAETDQKAKAEADKKPKADKEAADKAVTDAKAVVDKAAADLKTADEAIKPATEAVAKAQEAAKNAATAATAAAKAHTDAVAKQTAAAAAVDKDKENADLKKAKEEADKAVADAEAKKKAADEAKVAADKAVTDATAKKAAADKAKADATKANTDAANKVKAAEAKAKAAVAPAKKAADELTAANRTLATAKRSLDRAKQSVEKAGKAIPGLEAAVKTETAARDERQKQLDGAKKATAESDQPWLVAAFSSDGKTLATASAAKTIHTWDVATGAPIEIYPTEAPLQGIAFAKDGRLLTVAAAKTKLWDIATRWELAHTIGSLEDKENPFADRVTALAFSPDGKVLATGSGEPSRSGEIKLWNTEDAKLVREITEPHSDTVFALEFSRDGQYLASCAADRFMKVFQVADGKFVRAFEGHTHHVLGVSWSADGRMLATSGADKVVKIWDFRSGDQKRTITGFAKELTSIRFVGDSINVVASCGDKNVHIRRTDNGGAIRSLSGGGDFMFSVDSAADGKVFVAGGQDSVLRVWNDAGAVQAAFEPPKPEEQQTVSTK